jgi:pimeloyl-ACP methyl ester carboxylesterase
MNSDRYGRMPHICSLCLSGLSLFAVASAAQVELAAPMPPGIMVDLGGHRLHVNCVGIGKPTVVVENGLGDFSFDWVLVQESVSHFTRICTYDRAGYAWSDPGPMPRTYSQLNLELNDALSKLGERGPFILVGHSFGGPVIKNFAVTYPQNVAGMIFVDAAQEDSRYTFRGKAILMRSGAQGRSIPPPHEKMADTDKAVSNQAAPQPSKLPLDPLYNPLPSVEKSLQLWAQSLPEISYAEDSQRDWSPEYLQKWHDTPQAGILGAIPVIVLTRAHGGYDEDLDISAARLEEERIEGQRKLTLLSTNSKQFIVSSGHNMELEAPDAVASAIRIIVGAVRQHRRL